MRHIESYIAQHNFLCWSRYRKIFLQKYFDINYYVKLHSHLNTHSMFYCLRTCRMKNVTVLSKWSFVVNRQCVRYTAVYTEVYTAVYTEVYTCKST